MHSALSMAMSQGTRVLFAARQKKFKHSANEEPRVEGLKIVLFTLQVGVQKVVVCSIQCCIVFEKLKKLQFTWKIMRSTFRNQPTNARNSCCSCCLELNF